MNTRPKKPAEKRRALASSAADLRELKSNSSATVRELKEFLRELKGRSPQEMLGVVSASNLVRSLALSTALIAGLILILTAIPYFLAGDEPPAAAETGNAPSPVAPAPAESGPPPEETPPPNTAPDPLSNLGVGEELATPPDSNPLENQSDDFLKDLE